MTERDIHHQQFYFKESEPFWFYVVNEKLNVASQMKTDEWNNEGICFNHWHEELEFAYLVAGRSCHYINGELVEGIPGRLVVTNSEFIHNIMESPDNGNEKPLVIVIIMKPEFIRENFPEYQNIYFTNEKLQASHEIRDCIGRIRDFALQEDKGPYDHLYGKSLALEFLYLAAKEGTVERSAVDNINSQKNIERMKGIISYIEAHYMEHLTQAAMAERFYFEKGYFSKYFKKCSGMTFTEYLTTYRVEQAKREILTTKKSIMDIALDNGFSDDRRLILAFKGQYHTTPLQFRKKYANPD